MILYVESCKESPKKTIRADKPGQQGCRIHDKCTKKSVVFLCIDNEQSENEIKKIRLP